MQAFQLALALLFHKKTWILALTAAIIVPAVFPYLTPYEFNQGILEPARAQAACSIAMILACLWVLNVAARTGEHFRKSQLSDYLKVAGLSRGKTFWQLGLLSLVCLIPLALITLAICIFWCSPAHFAEASHWRTLSLQSAALYLLTFAPLALLAIALGHRFSALTGFIISLSLAVYGLYGVNFLEQLLEKTPMPLLDAVWHISPHYHTADLTSRFVFKMGMLSHSAFIHACLYLTGYGLLLGTIALVTFTGIRFQLSNLKFRALPTPLTATAAIVLISLTAPSLNKSQEVNPFTLFGSAYGKTVAMGMQSPIEFIWHEGSDTHDHEGCNNDEPHMHVVEKKVDYPNNLKGLITQLNESKKERTNPFSNRKLHLSYIRSSVERKIGLAWKMDPSHYDNYANYHLFLTLSDVAARQRDYQKATYIAERTLHFCRQSPDDPQAMLTAAAAAQNIIDVIISFQTEKQSFDSYKVWFDISQEHLDRCEDLLSPQYQFSFPYDPSYRQPLSDNLKRLKVVQKGLYAKSQQLTQKS